MSGVWVYDAAHSGWNELHPTRWAGTLLPWQCGKEIVLTYPGYPGLGPRPARGGIQGSGKPPAHESGGMVVTPHPPLKSTEEFQALVLDQWRFLLDQAEASATKEATGPARKSLGHHPPGRLEGWLAKAERRRRPSLGRAKTYQMIAGSNIVIARRVVSHPFLRKPL